MRDTLSQIPGVKSAEIRFEAKEAEVTYDKDKVTPNVIAEELDKRTQGRYQAKLKN